MRTERRLGSAVLTQSVLFVNTSSFMGGAEESLVGILQNLPPSLRCRVGLLSASIEMRDIVKPLHLQDNTLIAPSHSLVQISKLASRYDAIVIFSLDALRLLPILKILRKRTILDLHDWLPRRIGKLKLALAAALVDQVVAVSASCSTQLGAYKSRTRVMHRTIGDASRVPQHIRTDSGTDVTIGLIGRVDRDKNIELGVEAVTRVKGAKLIIRGVPSVSHDYAARLQEKSRGLLAERVEWQGQVKTEQVLDGIDILLVCRSDEPLGRTVLIAQAAGVPCVVPNRGGSSELVKDGMDGLHYEAGNPESLAAALTELSRGDTYHRLSRGAKASSESRLSLPGYALAYYDLCSA